MRCERARGTTFVLNLFLVIFVCLGKRPSQGHASFLWSFYASVVCEETLLYLISPVSMFLCEKKWDFLLLYLFVKLAYF